MNTESDVVNGDGMNEAPNPCAGLCDEVCGEPLCLCEEARFLLQAAALKLRGARSSMEAEPECTCRTDGYPCRACRAMAGLDRAADKLEDMVRLGC